jgi:hypothetical protein
MDENLVTKKSIFTTEILECKNNRKVDSVGSTRLLTVFCIKLGKKNYQKNFLEQYFQLFRIFKCIFYLAII